jgi:hypothetical protein
MQRRDVLQRVGVVGVAAVTAGLAGCSSDSATSDGGSGSEDGESGADDGGSGTNTDGGSGNGDDSSSTEVTGDVVENGVSGLEIVGWTTSTTDEDLVVEVTLENVGDQQTAASDYSYEAFAYDNAGEDITTGFGFVTSGTTVAPGETTTITLYLGAFGGPSEIAAFGLALRCGSGVYCQG